MTEVFVGRDHELAVLVESMERADRGSGRLVLVSGEPGIGKTRLAEELGRIAAARGATVSWGRAWEALGTPAYWPWLQVLRTLSTAAELSALFDPAATDHHEARFRLFDAIAQRLAAHSAVQPLVIILDDVHAADVSTLLLLQFVARGLRTNRVLVVATSRDSWFHASPQTSELLGKIGREALHLPLGRLGLDDVTQWMTEAAPDLAGRASGVFDHSEGNPLFVGELVAAAQQRPDAAWTPQQLPHGVREAVRAHLALLSESSARVLEAASVVGRELGATVDRAAIEEALALGIVRRGDDGKLRFAHVMLRDELYARLALDRRAALHRAAAQDATDPMIAARHHLLAADAAHARDATAAVIAAMSDATRRLAFEDAARLGADAIEVLAPLLAKPEDGALRIIVAEACLLAGRRELAFAMCERAAELGDAIGDPAMVARAAVVATGVLVLGRNDAVVAMLRRALAALPDADSPLRANVMARLAVAMIPPRVDEAATSARLREDAVAMARRLGDEPTLFTTLRLATNVFPETLPSGARVAFHREAIAIAERVGGIAETVPLLRSQVSCLLEHGDLEGAERAAVVADERLSVFRQPMYRWQALLLRATLAGLTGRFADAAAHCDQVLRLAREHDLFEPLLMSGIARTSLQYNRGDDDGFAELAPMILATQVGHGGAGPYLAVVHAARYDVGATRDALDLGVHIPVDVMPSSGALAWAALRVGLTDHALRLYAAGRDHFARVRLHFSPAGCSGPSALLLGSLAALAGDDATAERQFADALAFCGRLRARPYLAQTELAWAELLARRGARDEARRHADAAHAIADELGMTRVALAAAAIAGDAPAPRRPTPPPAPASTRLAVSRRGELWCLAVGTRELLLKDTKGLAYLEMLVRDPGRELHVLDLVGVAAEGDAGPHLDDQAKHAYRERAEELRDALETALRNHDLGRAERARAELEQIADELARAVGLGGRDRRAASQSERARINVQRRLRGVIRRIEEQDPDLARHLTGSLRTGLFCSYVPA